MKSPKGFGKNYFTFSSILAHAVQNIIQTIAIKVDYLIKNNFLKEDEEIDENDPTLSILTTIQINTKACHCNTIYKLKNLLAIKVYTFIARCPYYTTYFAFRRTGIHPPYIK